MAGANHSDTWTTAYACDLYGRNDHCTSPYDGDETAIDWSSAFSRMPWIDFSGNENPTSETSTTQIHGSPVQYYEVAHPSNFSRTPSNATVEHAMDSSLSMQHCERAATLPNYCLTDATGQRHYKDSKDAHGVARRKTQNRSA